MWSVRLEQSWVGRVSGGKERYSTGGTAGTGCTSQGSEHWSTLVSSLRSRTCATEAVCGCEKPASAALSGICMPVAMENASSVSAAGAVCAVYPTQAGYTAG
jgi:hypothetical protein